MSRFHSSYLDHHSDHWYNIIKFNNTYKTFKVLKYVFTILQAVWFLHCSILSISKGSFWQFGFKNAAPDTLWVIVCLMSSELMTMLNVMLTPTKRKCISFSNRFSPGQWGLRCSYIPARDLRGMLWRYVSHPSIHGITIIVWEGHGG